MKPIYFLLAALVAGVSIAAADPTTMPTSAPNSTVMIVPFKQVGEASSHGWVSSAIQENLLTAASAGGAQVIGLDHPLAIADSSEAVHAAQNAGASTVVYGSYQFAEGQLRINGQVADVNTNHVLGVLMASGAVIDLFKIEDALAAQMRGLLPQTANSQPQVLYGSTPGEITFGQDAAQQLNPTTDQSQQQLASQYPYDNSMYANQAAYPYYGYGYPYYGYGYGYWGYPYVIVSSGGSCNNRWSFRGNHVTPHSAFSTRGSAFGFNGSTAFRGGGMSFAARSGGFGGGAMSFAARGGGGFGGGGHGR